jgi:hypothetical protein
LLCLSRLSNVARIPDFAAVAIEHMDSLPREPTLASAGVMQFGDADLPAVLTPKRVRASLEWSSLFDNDRLIAALNKATFRHPSINRGRRIHVPALDRLLCRSDDALERPPLDRFRRRH